MGELGAETALEAANGEAVEPNIDTGTEMVTADNAAEFGGDRTGPGGRRPALPGRPLAAPPTCSRERGPR